MVAHIEKPKRLLLQQLSHSNSKWFGVNKLVTVLEGFIFRQEERYNIHTYTPYRLLKMHNSLLLPPLSISICMAQNCGVGFI